MHYMLFLTWGLVDEVADEELWNTRSIILMTTVVFRLLIDCYWRILKYAHKPGAIGPAFIISYFMTGFSWIALGYSLGDEACHNRPLGPPFREQDCTAQVIVGSTGLAEIHMVMLYLYLWIRGRIDYHYSPSRRYKQENTIERMRYTNPLGGVHQDSDTRRLPSSWINSAREDFALRFWLGALKDQVKRWRDYEGLSERFQ